MELFDEITDGKSFITLGPVGELAGSPIFCLFFGRKLWQPLLFLLRRRDQGVGPGHLPAEDGRLDGGRVPVVLRS